MHEAQTMESAYRISSQDQSLLVFVGKRKKESKEVCRVGHDKNNVVLALTNNFSCREKNITMKKVHLIQQSFFLPGTKYSVSLMRFTVAIKTCRDRLWGEIMVCSVAWCCYTLFSGSILQQHEVQRWFLALGILEYMILMTLMI